MSLNKFNFFQRKIMPFKRIIENAAQIIAGKEFKNILFLRLSTLIPE